MTSASLPRIIQGDCLDVLRTFEAESVDLILTSPPYADNRRHTYGGVPPEQFVEWFTPIAQELLRVLKKDGTFVLNIKEKVVDGERSTYVLELILALRAMTLVFVFGAAGATAAASARARSGRRRRACGRPPSR